MVYGAVDPLPTIKTKLADLVAVLKNLKSSEFKRPGKKFVFILKTAIIRWMIEREVLRHARKGIEFALLKKVDGCIDSDSPDRNDWLIDCDSQKQVYWSLHEILVLLNIVTD